MRIPYSSGKSTWRHDILPPHQSLAGRTPQEIYDQLPMPNLCLEVRGPNGVKLRLVVSHLKGQRDLPIVELKKAA